MKIRTCLLLFFCSCYSLAQAQLSEEEYIIDASQRPGSSYNRSITQAMQLRDETSTAVLLNGKLYKASLLKEMLPYIKKEEKGVKSVSVIKDKELLSRYSNNPQVTQLVAIKATRKLARQIRKRYASLANP